MYTKICTGCALEFTTPNFKKTRCASKCGVKRSAESRHGARATTRKIKHDTPHTFICVDGEGHDVMRWIEEWDDEEGDFVDVRQEVHEYALLGVGEDSIHHDGKRGLSHNDVFETLYAKYQENPDAVFCGFFLTYDFTMWLKSIDADKAFELLTKKGIAARTPTKTDHRRPWSVKLGSRWEIDVLWGKRFKLRPYVRKDMWIQKVVNHADGTTSTQSRHPHQWMNICDVGSYFQCSFLKAINPRKEKITVNPDGTVSVVVGERLPDAVVSDEEYARIKQGKDIRSSAHFDEDMIEYNRLENEVLARLMAKVDAGFRADGIVLGKDKWIGPGQAAQEWMRLMDCPKGAEVREAVPQWARDAAQQSYFGGWFEILAHGVIPGITYANDINSAYPTIIAKLPCLLHGTWTQGAGTPGKLPEGHIRLLNARVQGDSPYIGAMPHRRPGGTILRPLKTAGWYWQHEVEASIRAGLIRAAKTRKAGGAGIAEAVKAGGVIVDEWVEYAPCVCPPPLRAIEELYQGRLAVGKNSAFGNSKKLVYNSAYGKLAQSIGEPRYANPIWASLITAGCRTMILDAIATHPQGAAGVAMVATDSVTFFEPHPTIDVDGERLGAWDSTEHQNLSLMMPGLYWDDLSRAMIAAGEAPKLKSRGVSAKDLAKFIDEIDRQWSVKADGLTKSEFWPSVTIPIQFAMVNAKLAATRNAWHTCGKVTAWKYNENNDVIRTGDVRVLSTSPDAKRDGYYLDRNVRPGHVVIRSRPWSAAEERSLPYDKAFGDDPGAKTWQARINEEAITPDGTVDDAIHAVLPSNYR